MGSPELSIVIVNWNSADYVLECVRSIREQTSTVRYEIIVVDNASFDKCEDSLSRDFPNVIFIQSKINLGFGLANNLGAAHAKGDLLLLLNPDTAVMDRAIDKLYNKFIKLQDPGVAGCRLLNSDGSVQTSCVQSFPTVLNQILDAEILREKFPKVSLWGNAVLFEDRILPAKVEAVSGACMLIYRNAFEKVGGFSSEYFMYAEDIDLCYRLSREGLINYYIPEANIVHHGDGSVRNAKTNFAVVMAVDSLWRYFKMNKGYFQATLYRISIVFVASFRLLVILIKLCLNKLNSKQFIIDDSLNKWKAIYAWGIGHETWVYKYRSGFNQDKSLR